MQRRMDSWFHYILRLWNESQIHAKWWLWQYMGWSINQLLLHSQCDVMTSVILPSPLTWLCLRSPWKRVKNGLCFAITSRLSYRCLTNISNFQDIGLGDLYREISLFTLSWILISIIIHSWRKWKSNILKRRDFWNKCKHGHVYYCLDGML